MTTDDARVARLSVTPVKGLALHHPDRIDVSATGVAGDRAFFLVDDAGVLASCEDHGDLLRHRAVYHPGSRVLEVHGPDGLLRAAEVEPGEPVSTDFFGLRTVPGHHLPGWDELFSDLAHHPLRLVVGASHGHDVGPLTLIGSATVAALAEHHVDEQRRGEPVDGRRFRINVEVSGTEPLAEDGWEGREVRVGEVLVRVAGPVRRCATTTRHPASGQVDLQTLKLIGGLKGRQDRADFGAGFYLGMYAEVLTPGPILVGDRVVPVS